ncbi:hypothetical protein ALP45_02194 [Pseudomonas coronafaciens pv. atropurpurea]|nr:Uncharacterized protein ALO66_03250 [Pseudomonas coronafaciens pv. atropurpurea]RMT62112.1 hypothetical protein ALP45_02194 [Pseudomonas coronafaciens pv. atropurpurea]
MLPMSFEGIVQIQNEESPTAVNQMLEKGWELLAITASDIGPMYTVGRREVKKAPLDGFALGDHVTKG